MVVRGDHREPPRRCSDARWRVGTLLRLVEGWGDSEGCRSCVGMAENGKRKTGTCIKSNSVKTLYTHFYIPDVGRSLSEREVAET